MLNKAPPCIHIEPAGQGETVTLRIIANSLESNPDITVSRLETSHLTSANLALLPLCSAEGETSTLVAFACPLLGLIK